MQPLTDQQQEILKSNCDIFRNQLKPVPVIDILSELIADQKETLDSMNSDQQRTDYLMQKVLPKGSKHLFDKFKEALKSTNQSHLIPKLRVSRKRKVETPKMIHLHGQKYAKIMQCKKQPIVNIREYITDLNGKLYPTKKGILFSVKEWTSFKKEMKKVDRLLK